LWNYFGATRHESAAVQGSSGEKTVIRGTIRQIAEGKISAMNPCGLE
jgi:hypothetical protein